MFSNKLSQQLWHLSSSQLIKILIQLLCKNPNEIIRISNENEIRRETKSERLSLNVESENKNVVDDKTKNETESSNTHNIQIWEAVISCFEAIFKPNEGGFKNLDKHTIDELIYSCQDMEIQIINFIVNNLLPNSFKIPKLLQNKLLTLLDQGSVFNNHQNNNQSKSTQTNDFNSISRVFISNLFELCKYRSEDSFSYSKHLN